MAETQIGLHHVKALGSTCAEILGLPRLGVACGGLPATVSKTWRIRRNTGTLDEGLGWSCKESARGLWYKYGQ